MKAVRELKRFLPRLYSQGQMETRDVVFLLSKVREILENRGMYKNRFPELNLFCNWCAHSRLTGSNTIYEFLVAVNTRLSELFCEPDSEKHMMRSNAVARELTRVLRIPEFRIGLITVLEDFDLNPLIGTHKQIWHAFIVNLLYELSGKPLQFPDSVMQGDTNHRAYRYYDQVSKLPKIEQTGFIHTITVVHSPPPENAPHLQFSTSNDATIITDIVAEIAESEFTHRDPSGSK